MTPPHTGAHMKSRFVRNIQAKSNQNVALHFSASDPSASAKSMGYVTHQGSNCRRWVRISLRHPAESLRRPPQYMSATIAHGGSWGPPPGPSAFQGDPL